MTAIASSTLQNQHEIPSTHHPTAFPPPQHQSPPEGTFARQESSNRDTNRYASNRRTGKDVRRRYDRPLFPCDSFKSTAPSRSPLAQSYLEARLKRPEVESSYRNGGNLEGAAGRDFYFRKRRERLDWRLIASVHVERIIRETDINSLQEIMENITFCDVENEDLRGTDSSFIKLFRLSQLTIEYLLHSQDYLIAARKSARDALSALEAQCTELQEVYEKQNSDFSILMKENRALKKTLYAYQLISKVPGILPAGYGMATATYFRCRYCPKSFQSNLYLDSHLTRRHPDQVNYLDAAPPPQVSRPTSYRNEPNPPPAEKENAALILEQINATVEGWSEKITRTEKELREEMERRLESELSRKQEILDEQHKQAKLMRDQELQELKSAVHQQLREERTLLLEERRELEKLRHQTADNVKRSNIGTLEDDNNETREAALLSTIERRQNESITAAMAKIQRNLDDLRDCSVSPIVMNEEREQARDDRKALEQKIEQLQRMIQEEQEMRRAYERDRERDDNRKRMQEEDNAAKEFERKKTVSVVVPAKDDPIKHTVERKESFFSLKPASFHALLALMDRHTYTPLPQAPWIASLYPHPAYAISEEHAAAEKRLELALREKGITPEAVAMEEGRERIRETIAEGRRYSDAREPYLAPLRTYLAEQLNVVAAQQFRKRRASVDEVAVAPSYARKVEEHQEEVSPPKSPTKKKPRRLTSFKGDRPPPSPNSAAKELPPQPLPPPPARPAVRPQPTRSPKPPPIDTHLTAYKHAVPSISSAKTPGTASTVDWDTSSSSEDDSNSDGTSNSSGLSTVSEDEEKSKSSSTPKKTMGDRARDLGERVQNVKKHVFSRNSKLDDTQKTKNRELKPAPVKLPSEEELPTLSETHTEDLEGGSSLSDASDRSSLSELSSSGDDESPNRTGTLQTNRGSSFVNGSQNLSQNISNGRGVLQNVKKESSRSLLFDESGEQTRVIRVTSTATMENTSPAYGARNDQTASPGSSHIRELDDALEDIPNLDSERIERVAARGNDDLYSRRHSQNSQAASPSRRYNDFDDFDDDLDMEEIAA